MKNQSNLKHKIYILTTKPQFLSDAIMYLSKRNFEVILFESLQDLIRSTSENKPVCILLSSELIGNLEKIPKTISAHFNVPIIGHAEEETMSSMMKLNQMNVAYKIRPPASGAACYRVIQKILSEQKTTQV